MQDRPLIRTAIPKRRYRIGDYVASLLGEIESGDDRVFRYILAFVPIGEREPTFYVCAEQAPPAQSAAGRFCLRVINEAMSEAIDVADRWGDLDAFAEQGLRLGAQGLGLQRERVDRLM